MSTMTTRATRRAMSATLATMVAATLWGSAIGQAMHASTRATVASVATVAPCASDDGSGPRPCRWDASARGNGHGVSFTVATDGTVSTLGSTDGAAAGK